MARITEIAPDCFQITTFVGEINLQFHQFLIRDEEPLLYHTGMRGLFPSVREAVASLIDPAGLRWIAFSHFEADECGALHEWLEAAPRAQPVCSFVGAQVNVNDFIGREARGLQDGETFATGRRRFRWTATPHLPHCWEAGHLFEETEGTLLCSDLFHQLGEVEPVTEESILGRARDALTAYQAGPFANYMPYTPQTETHFRKLAALQPRTVATMHGSAYRGDGAQALAELADAVRDICGAAAKV